MQTLIESREAKLRNAVVMMKLRVVQHCFHEWSSKCVGVERRREMRTRQILGRIRNRAAVICLQAWIEATQRARKLKAYYAARWANILLAKLFLAWAHTAYREASIRLRTRAMAIRMARRTEVIVLQEWHRYASEARSLMRAAMVRWLNETLCNAWDAWVAFAADRERMIRLGRLVLGRYANALQSKCLLAWFSFAADAIESRQSKTAQAMMFLSGKQELVLRARFDAWANLVSESRQRREAAKRSVIVRVRNRLLAMAWQAWYDMHLEVGRAKKAANLWVDGAVSKAWRT